MGENSILNFGFKNEHEWGSTIDNQIKNDFLGSKQQVFEGYNLPYANGAINNLQYPKSNMDWALENMKKEPTGASCSYTSASAISKQNEVVYSSGTSDNNYTIVNPSSEKVESIAKSHSYTNESAKVETNYDRIKNCIDINGKTLYKKDWNNHQNTEVDVPVVPNETKGYMGGIEPSLVAPIPTYHHRKRKRESTYIPHEYNYQGYSHLNNYNTLYNTHWSQQQMMQPDVIYNPHVIQDLLQQQQMLYQQQQYLQQQNSTGLSAAHIHQWHQFKQILAVAQMMQHTGQQIPQPIPIMQPPIQQTIPVQKIERRKQKTPQIVEQIQDDPIDVVNSNFDNPAIMQQPLMPKLTVPSQNLGTKRKQKKPKAHIPSTDLGEYPVDLNQNTEREVIQDWLLLQQQTTGEKVTTGWSSEHVYNN